jgi:hypothetical protein
VHKGRVEGAMPSTRAVSTNRFGSTSSPQTDGFIEGLTAIVDPERAAGLGFKSAAPVLAIEKNIFASLDFRRGSCEWFVGMFELWTSSRNFLSTQSLSKRSKIGQYFNFDGTSKSITMLRSRIKTSPSALNTP